MNKNEIIKALGENHLHFQADILELNQTEFITSPEGKWTAGQHLQHIILSVSPVVTAFRLPLFVLKWLFGKTNRPSRTYDALVAKYKEKLAQGGRASARFVPPKVQFADRDRLIKKYKRKVNQLQSLVTKIPETDLDYYILPHPLLGKLTLREMLYFTAHHVWHHHELTKAGLLKLQNDR